MTVEQKAKAKAKQHTVYKNAAGKRVPGVTTITGVMDKPALLRWANRIGLEGIEMAQYVDELAAIGTLAHYMVECYLKKTTPNLDPYSKDQIDAAENSVLKFYEWEKRNKFSVIRSEMQLVSERLQVGGTCDCYCELNGKKTLVDFKTSKGVFDEHFTQVAGYAMILEDNGFSVQDVRILRIGRTEDEGLDDVAVPALALHRERFLACKSLYDINSQIRRAK